MLSQASCERALYPSHWLRTHSNDEILTQHLNDLNTVPSNKQSKPQTAQIQKLLGIVAQPRSGRRT